MWLVKVRMTPQAGDEGGHAKPPVREAPAPHSALGSPSAASKAPATSVVIHLPAG